MWWRVKDVNAEDGRIEDPNQINANSMWSINQERLRQCQSVCQSQRRQSLSVGANAMNAMNACQRMAIHVPQTASSNHSSNVPMPIMRFGHSTRTCPWVRFVQPPIRLNCQCKSLSMHRMVLISSQGLSHVQYWDSVRSSSQCHEIQKVHPESSKFQNFKTSFPAFFFTHDVSATCGSPGTHLQTVKITMRL